MNLDALIAFTQASYRNMKSLQVSLLNIKTNKRIYYSNGLVEYLLYPIACCLPHLRNFVYDDSSFLSTSEAHFSALEFGFQVSSQCFCTNR